MIDAGDAAFSLLLGAVATFNPCGFALLPAYITMIVTGSADGRLTTVESLWRAITFGLAMTLGFVAVFTGFGLLFGAVNLALQGSVLPYLPYVTTALGVVLVVFGVVMARGGEVKVPGLRLSPAGVGGKAPRADAWSQTLYGVSFALASLSCTIAPFFAVVTYSLDASNAVGAVTPFVVYAAGMGATVVLLSVAAAFLGSSVGKALRARQGLILRIAGVTMIAAGLWVILYGLAELLPRFDVTILNPILLESSSLQGTISSAVTSWGTPVLVTALAIASALVLLTWALARRERSARAMATGPTASAIHPGHDAPQGPSTHAVPTAPKDVLDAIRKATRS